MTPRVLVREYWYETDTVEIDRYYAQRSVLDVWYSRPTYQWVTSGIYPGYPLGYGY